MLARLLIVFIPLGLLVHVYPQPGQRVLAPLVQIMTRLTFPYVEGLRVASDGSHLVMTGQINLELIQADGSPLPPLPGTWRKYSGPSLHLLVLALALSAVPVLSGRQRLKALPLTLVAAALVGAYHLSVEIQESALRYIGYQWLPTFSMAPTEVNHLYFQGMETRFRAVTWIKSFNDAGGALFLAVLAGLIGYAWVCRSRGGKVPQSRAPAG
jgi:hypothetical protein